MTPSIPVTNLSNQYFLKFIIGQLKKLKSNKPTTK